MLDSVVDAFAIDCSRQMMMSGLSRESRREVITNVVVPDDGLLCGGLDVV